MALTLCRNWFSTECQVCDFFSTNCFFLQTVKPSIFYNLSPNAGRPVLINTTTDFVEKIFPPFFSTMCLTFIAYELSTILPCSADLKLLLRRLRSRTHCRVSYVLSFSSYYLSNPFMSISVLACSSHFLSSPFMFILCPFMSILFPFKSFHVHLISFMFISFPFKSLHVHLMSFHFNPMSFQILSCSSHFFHVHLISFQVLSCSSHFLSFPFIFMSFPFKPFHGHLISFHFLSCSSQVLSCSSHFLSFPFMFISNPFISFHVHLISFRFHLISFQVLSCSCHFLSFPFMFISSPFMFISFPFKSFHVHLISFHFHLISLHFHLISCCLLWLSPLYNLTVSQESNLRYKQLEASEQDYWYSTTHSKTQTILNHWTSKVIQLWYDSFFLLIFFKQRHSPLYHVINILC